MIPSTADVEHLAAITDAHTLCEIPDAALDALLTTSSATPNPEAASAASQRKEQR